MWAHGLDDRPVAVTFEQPAGMQLAGGDAAAPGLVAARVHGAEPAVPDGQPVGVRAGRDPSVHRRRRARSASSLHHTGTDAELDGFVKDVEKIVRQEGAIYGEYPGLRAGLLHVSRRLPAVGERRRHGAPQQHRDDLAPVRSPAAARQSARHGRARVLPLLERRAHPAARPRAVRLRSRQPVGRALARGRLHAVLRSARRCSARSSWTSRQRRARSAGLIESVSRRAGAPRALGGRDEPHGAVHRRRPLRRSQRTGRRRSFRTIRSAARSRWRSTSRCAIAPTAGSRSTTSCGRCGAPTASRAAAAKATSIIRTRSPTPRRRSRTSAATRVRARFLRAATSRAMTSPTTRACWRARVSRCGNAARAARGSAICVWTGRPRVGTRRTDVAHLRGRPRPGRRAAAGGRPEDRRRRAT